ncbi:MAG: aldo/keto reductase, partial [Cytophagaceae bacterium]
LKQVNAELARIEVKGERLPQMVLAFSDVEAPVKK